MTTHAANGVPKTSTGRPSLPYQAINPHLALLDQSKLPAVKFQVITRDGQEIVVGRIKIQTPNGHAFILRRYDTGAVSQTTMFRAAFPAASDDLERIESNWVKQNFDSTGANGGSAPGGGRSDALRLAGVWVRPEIAKTIAPDYSLESIIEPLLSARPDPGQEYRRSTKQNAAAQQANGAAAGGVAGIVSSSPVKPPSTSIPTSPPGSPKPKRRKEASIAATVAATVSTPAPPAASPKKAASTSETLGLPTPRRSGRTTSPAPAPAPVTPATRGTRSKVTKTTATKVTTVKEQPSARLATPEEDDEGEEADVPGPNMHEDIAEQRELIAKLKAERAQKEKEKEVPSAVPLAQSDSQGSSKRSREDVEEKKPLKFQFREPGSEETAVSRRSIRSNRRISFVDMEPQQKSAAWGALWFAAGLAAAATIPSFFM
ncbi:hypothetical protein ACEPAG_7401 [Sanghuangporus baumii]